MHRGTLQLSTAALLALGCAGYAHGSLFELDLSTHSSDQTPADLFDAHWDFSLVGSQLTIEVTNTTTLPDEYNINEIYFNLGGGWTGITLATGPSFWGLFLNQMVDGFGVFDVGIMDVNENGPSIISPGETETFIFNLTGSGSIKDITTATSTNGYLIAAKFVMGPGDDSGYGATIPTPGVLAMLGIAGIFARRPRRRRER